MVGANVKGKPQGLTMFIGGFAKYREVSPQRRRRTASRTSFSTAIRGGQFALHAMALPGNPYDGHTLATVIPDMERVIGSQTQRILADAGYRGHNAPQSHKLRVFTAGQ